MGPRNTTLRRLSEIRFAKATSPEFTNAATTRYSKRTSSFRRASWSVVFKVRVCVP